MTKTALKTVAATAILAAAAFGLVGCSSDSPSDKASEAVETAKDDASKAADDLADAEEEASEAGDALASAGSDVWPEGLPQPEGCVLQQGAVADTTATAATCLIDDTVEAATAAVEASFEDAGATIQASTEGSVTATAEDGSLLTAGITADPVDADKSVISLAKVTNTN